MASHEELVLEMNSADRMQLAERLKLARKRRAQQLKSFAQYEKQLLKESSKRSKKTSTSSNDATDSRRTNRLKFADSVLLLDATIRNDVDEVKSLLNDGVSPDTANVDDLTALHQCCIDNLEDVTRLLVENGANVNARDSELWSPLHAAATCGHVKLCRYLCEHGADLLAVNTDGNMAYDLCDDVQTLDYIESEMAKRGITQELIDETRMTSENAMLSDMQNIVNAGGDLEQRGQFGETPLHVAACNGYVSVVEFLLSHKVSVEATDCDDWRPLHCAACWGQYVIMEILLERGADTESKTRNGETALDLCEDIEMKQRLLEVIGELRNKRSTRLRVPDSVSSRRNSSAARRGSTANAAVGLCVRRSSVHEKSAISAKDVREEALMLRESISSLNDEEDEDEQVLEAITVTPEQLKTLVSTAYRDAQTRSVTTSKSDPTPATVAPSDVKPRYVEPKETGVDVTSTNGAKSILCKSVNPSADGAVANAPAGTLSDLKKQRARVLQERLLERMMDSRLTNGFDKAASNGQSAAAPSTSNHSQPLSVAQIYGDEAPEGGAWKRTGNGPQEEGCCMVM